MAKRLSEKEAFCVDAWMSNGNSTMAYLLSRDTPPKTDNPDSLIKMASRWLNDPRVKDYIESRRRVDYSKAEEVTSDKGNRSRADAVDELNALISSVTDPKIKGDLLLKLADLQKWKQAEQKDEDKNVVFYIPLSYDRCEELWDYLQRYYAERDNPGRGEKEQGKRPV